MTERHRIGKELRDQLVKEAADKLQRRIPDDVIIRGLIHGSRYSLSGARGLLAEARILADAPAPKKQRTLAT